MQVKASDSGSPQWVNQCYTLRTGDSVGMFYLDVDEASSGKRVGSAVISAAALEDGRTAFWATGAQSVEAHRLVSTSLCCPLTAHLPVATC